MLDESSLNQCADLLGQADSLLITAGAGMGVDAGLPDFRGAQGFWRAYPVLGKARIAFEEIANPDSFVNDPELAWGFYGHRLDLYRRTAPHDGHRILHEWARHMLHGAFVFTSNVDGMFQKAGFREVVECHGSIHRLQCAASCGDAIWSADEFMPIVDEERCRLLSPLPACPSCGGLARPNILMFGDWGWQSRVTREQYARLDRWLINATRLLVIELGAGTNVPTVRHFSEGLGAPLIRINPTEPQLGVAPGVSIAAGAREALQAIDRQRR